MNWNNPELPYQLSRDDILSLNILFNETYAMDINIKVIGEKEIPQSSKLYLSLFVVFSSTALYKLIPQMKKIHLKFLN